MTGARRRLTLTGGGARSGFWAQLFADVCNLPVETSAQSQSGAFGVALLAGVACGLWPDLQRAQAQTLRPSARFEPDPRAVADYDDWFGLYRDLRETYRGFSRQRSALLQAQDA
jgi:xylulokinase